MKKLHKLLPLVLGACAPFRRLALMAACVLAFFGLQTPANAALVEYDGTNVSWSVTDLLDPLTTALVAAVAAAVVIFTIVVGVRWIFRMVKGSK